MKKSVLNKLILISIITFYIFSLAVPKVQATNAIAGSLQEGMQTMQESLNEVEKKTGINGKSDGKTDTSISDIFTKADDFIEKGSNSEVLEIDKKMSDVIYNTLFILGTVIAVVVGIVIAIQFMVGSVEQRAKVKETLIAYVVGCVVIFGAFGIWKLVVNVLQGLPTN